MVRIIMHGCNGNMGRVITDIAAGDDVCEIVAGVDMTGEKLSSYPVFRSIGECSVEADVIIDFSSAKAVDDILDYSIKNKVPAVICSTGLSREQEAAIRKASEKVAVLKSANMSLGVNTLFSLVRSAAKILSEAGFDMEIIEKHHNLKKDAPSGTALAIADEICDSLGKKYKYEYDRTKDLNRRGEDEIGISAVRGGTIVGEHEVIFAGRDEVVEIKHTAYSKAIFAKGAVSAAKFLSGRKSGFYTMKDVIAEEEK